MRRRAPSSAAPHRALRSVCVSTLVRSARPRQFGSCCAGRASAPLGSADGSAGRPVRRMCLVRGVAWSHRTERVRLNRGRTGCVDDPAVHAQSGVPSQWKGRAMNQRSLLGRIGVLGVAIALVAGCSPSPDTSSQPTDTTISTPAPSAAPVPTSATAASVSPSEAPQPAWPYTSSLGIDDALFAEDGRVVLMEAGGGRITVLDTDGRIVPGWPWTPGPAGEAAVDAVLGPDGSLYVAARCAHGRVEPPPPGPGWQGAGGLPARSPGGAVVRPRRERGRGLRQLPPGLGHGHRHVRNEGRGTGRLHPRRLAGGPYRGRVCRRLRAGREGLPVRLRRAEHDHRARLGRLADRGLAPQDRWRRRQSGPGRRSGTGPRDQSPRHY